MRPLRGERSRIPPTHQRRTVNNSSDPSGGTVSAVEKQRRVFVLVVVVVVVLVVDVVHVVVLVKPYVLSSRSFIYFPRPTEKHKVSSTLQRYGQVSI